MPDAVRDVVAAIEVSKAKIAELKAKAEDPIPEKEEHVLKTCPVCGAVSDSRFCPDCGAPMDAE
jgi:transposase